jgi:hypothetical protein
MVHLLLFFVIELLPALRRLLRLHLLNVHEAKELKVEAITLLA